MSNESKRLQILKYSLNKKERVFADKINAHFSDVKRANGQPLNDKRNGRAALDRWERQSDSLCNLQEGIEKTKEAIEREESKISYVERTRESLPDEIVKLIDSGELIQWRKHPNTFFVPDVEKARIVWDTKKKQVMQRYSNTLTDQTQRSKFAKIF